MRRSTPGVATGLGSGGAASGGTKSLPLEQELRRETRVLERDAPEKFATP